jgi:hypothetical protein
LRAIRKAAYIAAYSTLSIVINRFNSTIFHLFFILSCFLIFYINWYSFFLLLWIMLSWFKKRAILLR